MAGANPGGLVLTICNKPKTIFPMARIKRIVRCDEDVGKISQSAPVILGKALQLFIAEFMDKTAEITQERNAKTITKSHMKSCVMKHDMFDFLKDMVKDIPERAPAEDKPLKMPRSGATRGRKRKAEADPDAAEGEEDAEAATPKDDDDVTKPAKRKARKGGKVKKEGVKEEEQEVEAEGEAEDACKAEGEAEDACKTEEEEKNASKAEEETKADQEPRLCTYLEAAFEDKHARERGAK